MLFTITGKHVEVTEAMRDHAKDKANKLPRFLDQITQVEVILEGKAGGQLCYDEVIIHAEHHHEQLIAKGVGEEMYACIDDAFHKIERQIKKSKERQRDNKHACGLGNIEIPAEAEEGAA